jgi:thiol-disulfide isomerase/thioredoxin
MLFQRWQLVVVGLMTGAGLLVAAPGARAQDGGISLGAKAPGAPVESLDGARTDLSKVMGADVTLLEFWATWCPNCKELEPALNAARMKYGRRVTFLTVAVNVNESMERVRRDANAHRVMAPVVYDFDGSAASAYDAPATSYIVIVNRAGRVVYTGTGGKQDINAAIDKALATDMPPKRATS